MDTIPARLEDLLGPEALADLVLTWLPSLVAAVFAGLGVWLVMSALLRLMRAVFDRVELDPTAEAFLITLTRFGLGLIGALAVLDQLGVKDDPALLADRPPVVVVTALNDYNVAVQLRVWLREEETHIAERMRLREAIFETLRSGGVDMPYETLQILRPPAA